MQLKIIFTMVKIKLHLNKQNKELGIQKSSLQSNWGTNQQKLKERKNYNSSVRYNKQLLIIVRARTEIDNISLPGKESNFFLTGLHVKKSDVAPSEWFRSEAD